MIAAFLPMVSQTPVKTESLTMVVEGGRRSVLSGESVSAKVWLLNNGSKPVVVVAPSPVNGELGVGFSGEFMRLGKPVATRLIRGQWYGQWMRQREFGVSSFRTIAPGGRLMVEDTEFRREFVSGQRPSLISELETSPQRDLPPGEYTYVAKWSFRRAFGMQSTAQKRWGAPSPTLTAEAKRLYARAWQGTLVAEVPVTVRSE